MAVDGPINEETSVTITIATTTASPATTPRKDSYTTLAEIHRNRLKAQTPPPTPVEGVALTRKPANRK